MKELEALSGAPAGKKSATKANTGPDVTSVAQVLADVHVTAQGAVVVLAATPHPDADHGYVAGDDLWDFNNRVKWNQPWTDQVWLDQVTVDEDDVDHFEPTYDVDFNRLLTHDGKGWTRTKLPKALPYGYVASTLRDLGAPWGLTGFGVSVLAFDGGPAHGRGKGPVLRAGGQGAEWAPRTAVPRGHALRIRQRRSVRAPGQGPRRVTRQPTPAEGRVRGPRRKPLPAHRRTGVPPPCQGQGSEALPPQGASALTGPLPQPPLRQPGRPRPPGGR